MVLIYYLHFALQNLNTLVILSMKNFTLLITFVFLLSCSPTTILDKVFQYKFYEGLDYKLLYTAPEVSESDLFLIHYAIIRQRDYFNYSVEGKTYGEILTMAKGFQQNGFPAKVNMNDNGQQDKVSVSAEAGGITQVRKKNNKKRLLKALKFNATIENPEDKEVVLLNNSFIVRGPFGDHVTTLNFEINCILDAKKIVNIGFIVPSETVKKNLFFEGSPYITQVRIDNVLNQLTIEPSGMSIKEEGRYFKECFFNASVLEPQVIFDYTKDFEEKEWKSKAADGTYVLDFGDMHMPPDQDEVIQMR